VLTRPSLALFAVLLIAFACAPESRTPPLTPFAQATSSPSHEPSPSPSSIAAPLAITAASFHAGEIGFAYAPARATAAGGVAPYAWSVSSGALPAGLSMSASGVVAGKPATLGTSLFTASVSDSAGNSASIDTTIAVYKHVAVTPTCPTNFPCMVEAGCLTACGVFGNQSGGAGPYTYKVISGAIPSGMGLNGFSLTRAFPAPATGATADWLFSVVVVDGIGATAQTTARFHVFPHIAFTQSNAACTGAQARAGCSTSLTYTLGTPGLLTPQLKSTPNPLPKGWSAVASKGTVTLTVPPPVCTVPGQVTSTLILVLVDGSTCAAGAGAYCSSAPATVKITLTC